MRRAAAVIVIGFVALGALVGPVAACSSGDDEGGDDEGRSSTPLVAGFSSEPDYQVTGPTSCPLRDITFTDESTGGPEEWRWEFSDGSTSDEQDPVVATAVYQATLTVSRGDDTDSITQDVSITEC